MYTLEADVAALEAKLGKPVVRAMSYEIDASEFDMVEGSMYNGRAHDVTMFIRKKDDPGRIVVIRKPFFPPEAFRAPSGAANRGESLEDGAVRESKEETGLDVQLTRYLARINARFTSENRVIDWTSHILEAREISGKLEPIDTHEIAEAKSGRRCSTRAGDCSGTGSRSRTSPCRHSRGQKVEVRGARLQAPVRVGEPHHPGDHRMPAQPVHLLRDVQDEEVQGAAA
jgi:ADP-ribose pyrophosphatase YjhB (NUDIX family)